MARQDAHPPHGNGGSLPSGDRSEPSDVATVTTPQVACEGVAGEDSHPLVFMTFGLERDVVCPYCSRRYRLSDAAPPGPPH